MRSLRTYPGSPVANPDAAASGSEARDGQHPEHPGSWLASVSATEVKVIRAMDSLKDLYRIGHGPSSSHTLGPGRTAAMFQERHPRAGRYRVTLFGTLVKSNASISGAEVGCQGEVGTACAMAAAAATQLCGDSIRQIEYAAEMGLEHHLGLTCDPIAGLVQIPCIERNAHAAARAVSCCNFALLSDGTHKIPFDEVVAVLDETGHSLPSLYRETALGGLAKAYRERDVPPEG